MIPLANPGVARDIAEILTGVAEELEFILKQADAKPADATYTRN